MDGSRPGPNCHKAVPERCVELVNGETMATGTYQRYDIVRDFESVTPDGANAQMFVLCSADGDILSPGSAGGTQAVNPGNGPVGSPAGTVRPA